MIYLLIKQAVGCMLAVNWKQPNWIHYNIFLFIPSNIIIVIINHIIAYFPQTVQPWRPWRTKLTVGCWSKSVSVCRLVFTVCPAPLAPVGRFFLPIQHIQSALEWVEPVSERNHCDWLFSSAHEKRNWREESKQTAKVKWVWDRTNLLYQVRLSF